VGHVLLKIADPAGVREVSVDHVVAATGYRVSLERLTFLPSALRASLATRAGSPHLNASFESSVPGLYLAGLAAAATFGPLMRFVAGSQFAARRITRALTG
jgi:hypothetical protein